MDCKLCHLVKKIELIESLMLEFSNDLKYKNQIKKLNNQLQQLKKDYQVCEHQFEIVSKEQL